MFFFCKQKTAYEMRISDWSSDVCSSDLRHPTQRFAIGVFERRPGKRLITVGADCAVGKMYTALAIERELRRRSIAADFRATGQTGILIVGAGVSVDAVISDFVAAAARSEERRVGKECVRTGRSRWSQEHTTKKTSLKNHVPQT